MLPQLKFAPYIQPFVGGLSEEATQQVKQRLGQYYQAQDEADAIGYAANQLRYQTLPNDALGVENIVQSYNSKLQEYVNRGDYENLGRAIKMDARRFNNDITPFLQRKAQYDNYVKEINSNKDLSETTKKLAVKKSLEMDKGYDPSNPESSLSFNGYVPNKDVNIADKIDKFTEGFRGDSVEYEIPDYITGVTKKVKSSTNLDTIKFNKNGKTVELFIDDNGNFNTDNVGRPVTQIEYAARNYANADNEIKGYAESQGYLTGSNQKISQELNNAIQASLQKVGYVDKSLTSDISIPTSYDYMRKIADNNADLDTTTAGFIPNSYSKNIFDSFKFNPNTGSLQEDTETLLANPDGSYSRIINPITGKQMSVAEYKQYIAQPNSFGSDNSTADLTRPNPKLEPISKEEAAKVREKQNENFNELVKLSLLAEKGLLYPKQGQSPTEYNAYKNNILYLYRKQLEDPAYREKVLKSYKEDINHNQNIEVPKIISNNNTGIKIFGEGEQIISNISNRVIHINQPNSELELTTSSLEGANDYKTLLEKLPKGWEVEATTESGLLFGNPQGINPATQVMLTLKNKETGKKTVLNISAESNPLDRNYPILQKINEIYTKSISGNGGIVKMPGAGAVKITSIPLSITGEGKGFKTIVQPLDANGLPDGEPEPYVGFINKLYQGLKINNIINTNKK